MNGQANMEKAQLESLLNKNVEEKEKGSILFINILYFSCIRHTLRFPARGFLALTKNAWFLGVP